MAGWKKELPRLASRTFSASTFSPLPVKWDLELFDKIPVYDQEDLGSCTANMGAAAWLFQELKNGKPLVDMSRLFLYAATRQLEGTPLSEDSGAQIVDVYRTLLSVGICREDLWPYQVSQFSVDPSAEARADAKVHESILDYACPNVQTIKGALLRAQVPVGFGFTVFESFQSDHTNRTGEVSYPEPGEAMLGGHANIFRGWDDHKAIGSCIGAFRSRNSYGPNFGDQGDIWIPYKMVEDGIASDARALVKVTL